MDKDIAFFIVSIICLALIGWCTHLDTENRNLTQSLDIAERKEMFNASWWNESEYINGVAFDDKYYCVWTKGRTEQMINKTDVHEQCHILIELDTKNHFCDKEN